MAKAGKAMRKAKKAATKSKKRKLLALATPRATFNVKYNAKGERRKS